MNYLYEVATGRLVSTTALPVPNPPAGMAVKAIEGEGTWNPATLELDPLPPVVETVRLAKIDFLRLLTVPERIAIRTLGKTDVIIEDFLDMINAAQNIELTNADTVAGVGYMVQQELLTPERGAAVLAGELP